MFSARAIIIAVGVMSVLVSPVDAIAQRSFREQLQDIQQATNMQLALIRRLANDDRFAQNMRAAVTSKRFGDAVTLAAEAAGVPRESFTISDAMPSMETGGPMPELDLRSDAPLQEGEHGPRASESLHRTAATAIYACAGIRRSIVTCTRIVM